MTVITLMLDTYLSQSEIYTRAFSTVTKDSSGDFKTTITAAGHVKKAIQQLDNFSLPIKFVARPRLGGGTHTHAKPPGLFKVETLMNILYWIVFVQYTKPHLFAFKYIRTLAGIFKDIISAAFLVCSASNLRRCFPTIHTGICWWLLDNTSSINIPLCLL